MSKTTIVLTLEDEPEAVFRAFNHAQQQRVVATAARAASMAIAEIALVEGTSTAEAPRGILSAEGR